MARATRSAILSFGLVSIPVKLYTSAKAEGVEFRRMSPKGNRVKQQYIDAVTGEVIQQTDCNKGFEHAKDEFVIFTKDEIKELEAEKSSAIEIKEFVPASSFDPIMVEKSYYLGTDKGGDKGYCLLAKVMKKTGKVAVARWNAYGREHLILVRPYRDGLVLHQMFYSDEIRPFEEITEDVAKVDFHEVEEFMAEKLVEQLSGDSYDASKYVDGYVTRVKTAVDQKLSGNGFTVAASVKKTSATDLMAALKASLDAATAAKKA